MAAAPKINPLDEVRAAFTKRREIASRLSDQDLYAGHTVRLARADGHTWQSIAEAAGTSDVAVLKASRRPPKG